MFYGDVLAGIHHERFGDLAATAARRLIAVLRQSGHEHGLVYDVGCGSGILAREVIAARYAVTGFDISSEMVAIARRTAPGATLHVGSAHHVAFDSCVAIAAIGEVLNYAADPIAGVGAVTRFVTRAHAALRPGGVLLFDVALPGRHGAARHNAQFHDAATWALGMNTTESDDGTSLERTIAIFASEKSGDRYRRHDERHTLRLYEAAKMREVLTSAGFVVEISDSYGSQPTRSTLPAGWAVFLARKPQAADR